METLTLGTGSVSPLPAAWSAISTAVTEIRARICGVQFWPGPFRAPRSAQNSIPLWLNQQSDEGRGGNCRFTVSKWTERQFGEVLDSLNLDTMLTASLFSALNV